MLRLTWLGAGRNEMVRCPLDFGRAVSGQRRQDSVRRLDTIDVEHSPDGIVAVLSMVYVYLIEHDRKEPFGRPATFWVHRRNTVLKRMCGVFCPDHLRHLPIAGCPDDPHVHPLREWAKALSKIRIEDQSHRVHTGHEHLLSAVLIHFTPGDQEMPVGTQGKP